MTKPDWIKPAAEVQAEELEKARTAARQRVESAYQSALSSFLWDGVSWDARDERANILRDILNRLANGRGLPRGKDTVTLRDNAGASHDLTADQVVDLGAAGSDHRDLCMETRLSLLDQIETAETVDAINDINWPTKETDQ